MDPFSGGSSAAIAQEWGLSAFWDAPGIETGGTIARPIRVAPQEPTARATTARRSLDSLEFAFDLDPEFRPRGTSGGLLSTRSMGRPARVAFPWLGSEIGGFRLIGLLGRGSFAHVYLAEEVELAGRRVALKVSRAVGDEPQTLARLQHTHIVPIYSVRDDPSSGLRLLCMPYFGGANLAEVLRAAGARLPAQATGKSLVEALDRLRLPTQTEGPAGEASLRAFHRRGARGSFRNPVSPASLRSLWARALARFPGSLAEGEPSTIGEPIDPPGIDYLRSHSYVESSVWIAARLAEGLEHAHSRGFLHRDLKPSNVLIAADGTPMLLDFNLSADLGRAEAVDEDDRKGLGGTLPYMAPEHLDAFNPLGSTPPEAVDERSDIYALGLILFEMVAGRHPFAEPDPGLPLSEIFRKMTEERRIAAPSARSENPEVSPGLDSILKTCLDPEPDRRYASAGDLAEDLRRHLDHRPLKFAADRSPTERLKKWSRRHPRASGVWSIAGFALAAILSVGAAASSYRDGLATASARIRYGEFRETFGRCQLLLNTTGGRADQVARGLSLADRALAAYGVDRPGVDWMSLPSFRRLAPADRRTLREEISELLLLEARCKVALVARNRSEAVRGKAIREAIRRLDLAERIDPRPSAALFEDRARDLAAIGEAERARRDRLSAASTRPESARDHYLLGTGLLAVGDRDRAESSLSRAVALDPRRFWAWFALGLCHLDQGRSVDASGDFAACTVIAPEFSWPHLNRGLALARSGRLIEARSAYDRALALEPDFIEARVDRALARLELDDPAGALDDLDAAISLGKRRDPAILAARAEAQSRLGRRAEAERDFAEGLRIRPTDPAILTARGFSRLSADPSGASNDFDLVLTRDPRHGRAHLGRALLLQRVDPRAALIEADAALGALPGDPDVLTLRALVRARLGDLSALADVDAILQIPSPHRLYNAACALALIAKSAGDDRYVSRGRDLLDRAIQSGFDRAIAARDPDLEPLRSSKNGPPAAR